MATTVSNLLSALRLPLAFFFLNHDPKIRFFAIVMAMITDCLDGFIARRYKATSQLGAILDPSTDKFFVIFALSIFIYEGQITIPQAAAMVCRDFSVLLFGLYLAVKGYWGSYQFRSIWAGKITTTLQFFVLVALTFKMAIPSWIYFIFVILGILALIELYFFNREVKIDMKENSRLP